jgi:glyoxylase-like metal-dependent hydrolase (beta-lactamase superfamily II)
MELYKGVHRISSLYGGRNLFQYLFVGNRSVLVDSGVADTPEKSIFPYMERLGVNPARLAMLITTHPDLDHQGGNAAIHLMAPGALVACGEEDRHMVQDPARLYRDRYNYLQEDHGLGFGTVCPDAGSVCRVDVSLRGGERIALADGWELEVLHVPGHSHGHLALFDRERKTAFISDAIHGRGCPKADGTMGIPVTYFYVDLYLSTLTHLEGLDLETLHTGHWPSMDREEIRDFFNDSRKTVEILDRRILSALERSGACLTLNELIGEVLEEFPDWPVDTRDLAMFPVKGHLERLEWRGRIQVVPGNPPRSWQLM